LLEQLKKSGARVNFSQGLDIRLVNSENTGLLKQIKIDMVHFAWDNYGDKPVVVPKLERFKEAKGVTCFLDRRRAAAWYALAALRLKVDRGHLPLSAPNGKRRIAQINDLVLFLRQGFQSEKDLLEWNEKD
jgi:hypothetical protein